MAPAPDRLTQQIEQYARSVYPGHDPAHDILHIRRVLSTALRICASERGSGTELDATVVVIACWLHDVVQIPKGSGLPGEAARQSATVARDLLRSLGAEPGLICAVKYAIATHSYSSGIKPETIEAGIVQDADRIDALGATGIARLWIVASQRGSKLYDERDPAAAIRKLDDRRFALDHIRTKLLKLPATMNTATGREIAEARAATVATYYEAFIGELDVSS